MNIFHKTIFWAVVIISGFASPAISGVLVVLYYLPSIISEYDKKNNQSKSMREYSEDFLEEMK